MVVAVFVAGVRGGARGRGGPAGGPAQVVVEPQGPVKMEIVKEETAPQAAPQGPVKMEIV